MRERLPLLDLPSIRSTLAMIEEALGQSDLRPLFERELAAAGPPQADGSNDDNRA